MYYSNKINKLFQVFVPVYTVILVIFKVLGFDTYSNLAKTASLNERVLVCILSIVFKCYSYFFLWN